VLRALLLENVRPGGMVNELAAATGKRIVFYCAFGERSAMVVWTGVLLSRSI
jgi:hypothetical protein